MIKKLSKKHGTQFVDDVMATFGMPTDTTNEYVNSLKQTEKCERLETDREFEIRQSTEALRADLTMQRELKQLNELKQKYNL